jgi:hypothetical protein
MPRLFPFTAAVVLFLLPSASHAHAPIPGVGAFWNGAVHPLLVLPHLLFLLGFGLLLGQNVPAGSRAGIAAFAVALLPAVALAGAEGPGLALLAAAMALAGFQVALGRTHWVPIAALGLCGALLVGLDSAPAALAGTEAWLARAGTFTGALLVVILAGGLAAAVTLDWQKIGVRIGGAWIAAAAILIFTFDVTGTGAR